MIDWFVSLVAGHIHEESPAVPICLKFLLRKCSEGTECPEHHCFLPYHWQYNVSSGVEWKNFSEKDNLALEKLYCDVNVEGPVKLNLAQAIARYVLFLMRSSLGRNTYAQMKWGIVL